MPRFEGKAVLITGGGGSIGRATAIAFAKEGAAIVIANRDEGAGAETVSLIEEAGGKAMFARTDVTREADVAALLERSVERFGRIDVAFNSAGVEGSASPLHQQSEADFDRVIDTNVKGVFLSMKYEIAHMLERGGGSIINCTSVVGVVAMPGFSPYTASKHAIIGLTKAAALEVATSSIRVNAVAPGGISSPMAGRMMSAFGLPPDGGISLHPVGRMGLPEDVATVVLFLASPEASFITGHTLLTDGGYSAQ